MAQTEKTTTIRYSHQSFRPEAVEAYSTRQAGDPWDAKQRMEGWLVALLTLIAFIAMAFILLGRH